MADWADVGGYDIEVLWDTCCVAALGIPFGQAKTRPVSTLSGGEQKRLVLEALLRGPDDVLLLDEPDNFLDVPAKRWLEDMLDRSQKSVLFVSHDRELLARSADRVVTVELGGAGNTLWTHPAGFETYHRARRDRFTRFEEVARRCDTTDTSVRAWRRRFVEKGVEGVGAIATGRGRKPWLPPGTVAAVLDDTMHNRPDDGSTHWTTRLMARRHGIGKDTVARIWRDHGLKPWKVDTFKISTDPNFEEKLV